MYTHVGDPLKEMVMSLARRGSYPDDFAALLRGREANWENPLRS